ncbi:MAG: hypothetical protein ACFFCU_18355, partial [Promethearchaeota archaeon]
MVSKSVENVGKKERSFVNRMRGLISHSYSKFVMKKALFYLIVIIIALTFVFAIPRFMPGDPVERFIRPPSGNPNPEALAQYREIKSHMLEFYGLNKSLFFQYIDFWTHLLQFDLGSSYTVWPTPVIELIIPRLAYTLLLVIPVLFISFFIGNWIGGRSAFLKGRLNDLVYFLSVLAANAPFYWLGIIILVYFVIGDNIFLSHPGGVSPQISRGFTLDFFIDTLRHFAPP